jgi:hypothetical protein
MVRVGLQFDVQADSETGKIHDLQVTVIPVADQPEISYGQLLVIMRIMGFVPKEPLSYHFAPIF